MTFTPLRMGCDHGDRRHRVDPSRPSGSGSAPASRIRRVVIRRAGAVPLDDGGATLARAGSTTPIASAASSWIRATASRVRRRARSPVIDERPARRFCTRDDGASWTQVLAGDTTSTGAVDSSSMRRIRTYVCAMGTVPDAVNLVETGARARRLPQQRRRRDVARVAAAFRRAEGRPHRPRRLGTIRP